MVITNQGSSEKGLMKMLVKQVKLFDTPSPLPLSGLDLSLRFLILSGGNGEA